MAKKFLDEAGLQIFWNAVKTYITNYVSENSPKYDLDYVTNGKNYQVTESDNKLYVNVPWENTTYTFSKGANGSINIEEVGGSSQSVEIYTHPDTPGNKHIPAGGETGQFLKWNADGTATWANVSKTDVGLGDDAEGAIFTNAILLGRPTAPTAPAGDNSEQIANTSFVQTEINNKLAELDAIIYKGTLGTDGTIQSLPTTHGTGWAYKVITAGNYANYPCEVGDMIISIIDRNGSSNADSDWTVVQNNVDLVGGFGSLGLIKNGSEETSTAGYTPSPIINGIPYYKDTDTTYNVADVSTPGLVTVGYSETTNGSAEGDSYSQSVPVQIDGSNLYINIGIMTRSEIEAIVSI